LRAKTYYMSHIETPHGWIESEGLRDMSNDVFSVHAAPLPFHNLNAKHIFAAGTSLEQIAQWYLADQKIAVDMVILLNGEVVDPTDWPETKPTHEDHIALRVMPAGGGGGKSPIVTLLSVAIAVAAPGVGSFFGTSILNAGIGLTAGQGILIGRIAAGVFGVVGRLAINALAGPNTSNSSAGTVTNPAESPTQFVEGARNAFDPYGVVPVCLGTNRMVPPQCARPYTETSGNDQFSRQLFAWGYGNLNLSDLKIGETALSEFDGVSVQHRLDGNLYTGTDLYTNDVFQEDFNATVSVAGGAVTRSTQAESDEAIVDLTWGQGLVVFTSQGARATRQVTGTIRYRPTSGGSWTSIGIDLTAAQTEPLRKSYRIVFPSNGQYDIEISRTSADATSDQARDAFALTAIKSVKYTAPVVEEDVSGTALRIKGTDQLNGAVDELNGIVSLKIPDYQVETDSWITRETSNPASIYRYVLQGDANDRPASDSDIDIEALEEWHTHCVEQGYSYNRVIDYEASVEEILKDVASSGSATPARQHGIRTVVVDKLKDDIVQMFTPRNSWNYHAELTFPERIHALKVNFRDASNGYLSDQRVVYDDGYDASNATKFEVINLPHCTDSDLAYKHGRRYLATARLRPETHYFDVSTEHLVAKRGQRIILGHDIPQSTVGDGRVTSVTDDGTNVTGFTIDDEAEFISGQSYHVRIRKADGTMLYLPLGTSLSGYLSSFTLTEDLAIASTFEVGDLCYFVETGQELDLIIKSIRMKDDLVATIEAVDYAPEIFTAESAPIPQWTPTAVQLLSMQRPAAPVLAGEPQSDEDVMILNSDGSLTARMVIPLQNDNDGTVEPIVRVRLSGTTEFRPATLMRSTAERVEIIGLDDGLRYDVWVSYRRVGSSLHSRTLQINNYRFVGATGVPDDVQNFLVSASSGTAHFSWTPNDDIDLSHYEVRFSNATSGAEWETSPVLDEKITGTNFSAPYFSGTYFIKAVDRTGNESANAKTIVATQVDDLNAVETITEDSAFSGGKTNITLSSGSIKLTDNTLEGTYAFANDIDLGGVFESRVSADISATAALVAGAGSNNVFAMEDIFAETDIFGIGAGKTRIRLQIRTTSDDPTGSPTWSDWEDVKAGLYTFWGAEFRLIMESLESTVTPVVDGLSVTIDMPDRIERADDVTVTTAGRSITYSAAFNVKPAISIAIQDGQTGDYYTITSNTASGFTVTIYDATDTAVERVIDWIASGYGRVQ
jgi:hypothetical protein